MNVTQQHLIDVSIAVQALGHCDGVKGCDKLYGSESAQFFLFACHMRKAPQPLGRGVSRAQRTEGGMGDGWAVGEVADVEVFHLGHLFGVCFVLKHIRPDDLQVHQSGRGDSLFSPLRHRGRFDLTQLGDFERPAKCIYDLCSIHGVIIRRY